MIPNNLSIVTLTPQRQAALAAVIDVEQRQAAGKRLSDYPYARTYFRILTGTSRPRRADMWKTGFYIEPGERKINLKETELAFDILLSSQGKYCLPPLRLSIRDLLFPEVVFKDNRRHQMRAEMSFRKQERREIKRELKRTALCNLIDSAVIDLNFQTPETIKEWYDRWQEELFSDELEAHFWRWMSRFPSLRELEQFRGTQEPLWSVIYEASLKVAETPSFVKAVESLFVPNKLGVLLGEGMSKHIAANQRRSLDVGCNY